MSAEAEFQVTSWEEDPAFELETGGKVTRAQVTQAYRGEIEGESRVEYVMFHRRDGTAGFTGFECFEGSVHGRSGSLVFQHDGGFKGGIAASRWRVVPGSGTAALVGVTGAGTFEAGHDMKARVTFEIGAE